MIWLKLLAFNIVLSFLINAIFCFNRTVYVLLVSILSALSTSIVYIVLEFEFLGLVFATVYVGGIAVMFLFLILTVDVRVENNEKVFVWAQMKLWKIISSVVFSTIFSFIFLWFCDPMLFASVDFYLFCNKKILLSWSYVDEPVYLVHQKEALFSHILTNYLDPSSVVYSNHDIEYKMWKDVSNYTPFTVEFFFDYFVYNDYIDDVYTLGVLFFFYHSPLLVLIGLFLLVTTIVAVIICLNIFG